MTSECRKMTYWNQWAWTESKVRAALWMRHDGAEALKPASSERTLEYDSLGLDAGSRLYELGIP